MKTISLINMKGGVGKTTLALEKERTIWQITRLQSMSL